ncbi:glycoside hydrolase family 20 protein [Flavobacterium sp. GT3R68]|uniref:glycoside hydrolase family 20 protein n=1 Tax=Flavobacterium sp. GT3R68 TaxID=2594437 RepID=UPI000F896F44|nr:glycoside hydrolase family 20 protein [Flavobacterium sp. GT3R68]RTY92475.1 beta-N-acetylhexosaminidase [Flavobacterium sp. GSN2]TRW94101.1 family 20 glycosylhydrolase [Flavobacterium sp. GT3R68]
MIRQITYFLLLCCTIGFTQNPLPIIPQPKELKRMDGNFTINRTTKIVVKEVAFQKDADLFNQFLLMNYGYELQIVSYTKGHTNIIEIQRATEGNSGSYTLNILPSKTQIASNESQGIFYAFQTLIQLLPLERDKQITLPCLQIKDEPKYQWRGMHLDVGRHLFPTAFIKKYIDYMAMYKMNTFHWHLTEDQGWRIEIKKYPKLTQIAAWRKGSIVGHYRDQIYDTIRYGGFYTQDEIKEVVAYAKKRHITVVPEIEMPGHSQAALAAYPELACTSGPFEVATKWGVLEDVYCPNEATFEFLENVLTEVLELFPSEYIHIGGDECPKIRWKNCAHCQALIKSEGLKNEHELQSYFIKRIEKFLNFKGRKIIGWDEILEGGLAPNAAVMSWRGTQGGIDAAKQHHNVVMTPSSHCYFDHYQGDPKYEPIAIGGYTPVEKVYAYDPTPAALSPEEAKYIMGAQGNVWTEYINTPEHVEYMTMPRMAALAEVVWGTSNPNNYKDFQNRLLQHFAVLDKMGVNYSKAIYGVTSKVAETTDGKGVFLTFSTNFSDSGIRYTTDGSDPKETSKRYANPILIDKSTTVKATLFENGKQLSPIIEQAFAVSKSTGKKVTLKTPPHQNYNKGGAFALVDGMLGSRLEQGFDWLGFLGKDLEAVIDLAEVQSVSKVALNVHSNELNRVYYPKNIIISVSENGTDFKTVKEITLQEIERMKGSVIVDFTPVKTKYVKVIALNAGKIPEGKVGASADAWLLIDEIRID